MKSIYDALVPTPATIVRLSIVGLVYGLGAWSLTEVQTTAGEPLSIPFALFQAANFFQLDPWGMPLDGPPAALGAYWVAMFVAPVLLLEMLIASWQAIYRRVGSSWRMRRLKSPILVVCGFGLTGRAIAAAARKAGFSVVVVDGQALDGGTGAVLVESELVPFVHGDFGTPETLLRAELGRAAAVWFCAGKPTVNLRGAHVAASMPTECRIVPLVDDDLDAKLVVAWAHERGRNIEALKQYDDAARSLVHRSEVRDALERALAGTNPPRIALVGFGRFGRAVLQPLLELVGSRAAKILVVDRAATAKVEAWDSLTRGRLVAIQRDADDWTFEAEDAPALVFVCTSEDLANLRLGARVRQLGKEATIVLRLFDPQIARAAQSSGVESRSIGELVADVAKPLLVEQFLAATEPRQGPAASR